MIKMIVSDLDGTLLTLDNQVRKKDKEALASLVHEGIVLSIATGRMDHEILKVLENMEISANRISQNGAFLYSIKNELLANQTFAPDLAQKIYRFLPQTENSLVTIFSENQAYVTHRNQVLDQVEPRLFFPVIEDPTLIDKLGKDILPSKITVHAKTEFLQDLEKEFIASYTDIADCYISDAHCLDIMPKNISKGNAVKNLISQLGIENHEIACIGDSFNDISMFQLTPYSFAMTHADAGVKEYANYEVDYVYQAIDLLKKEGMLQTQTKEFAKK